MKIRITRRQETCFEDLNPANKELLCENGLIYSVKPTHHDPLLTHMNVKYTKSPILNFINLNLT